MTPARPWPSRDTASPRLPFFTPEPPRPQPDVEAGPLYTALLQDTEHTVEHLLHYYLIEVAPQKAARTQHQIQAFAGHLDADLRALHIPEVPPAVLRAWRDRLSQTMKAGSVPPYMEMLS